MDKKTIKDYKNKSVEELSKNLKESYLELGKIKMDQASNKQKNLHLFKNKRKEIAKMKTVLREKELEVKNG